MQNHCASVVARGRGRRGEYGLPRRRRRISSYSRSTTTTAMIFGFFCFIRGSLGDRRVFNQTAGYGISVDFDTWSNFGEYGGCVSCPYTCVKPLDGPGGIPLNFSNHTQMSAVPAAYTKTQMNGCCYAHKSKSTQAPDCNQPAAPTTAEDCGFTYGPSLTWSIQSARPPEDAMRAMLFASIDCTSFWAVGQTFVKQDQDDTSAFIEGRKIINGGCYGDPAGVPIVLAGCLSSELKFDKQKGYSWDMLARQCKGLSGQCSRTNGLWGQNLKCCTNPTAIQGSQWDLTFEKYHEDYNTGSVLSGGAIFGVVFGGVALLMCMVHNGKKIRERARKTALIREQENNDDYEEIVTPLTGRQDTSTAKHAKIRLPDDVDISLHEGDQIYRPPDEELILEGDMY